MQASIVHNRHLVVVTVLLVSILGLFYILQPSSQITSLRNEGLIDKVTSKEKTICDKVDIGWLAGDRHYWDGWSDKAMFIKQDGTFTQGNVYINQGEEVCIVVLLGPIPASKKDDSINHTGPKDSIVMFANGLNFTKVTIELQQDLQHPIAYFKAVKFQQPDTYQLNAINEYRSYFWELPVLHSYHPTPFESQNKLIVQPINTNKIMEICDLKNKTQQLKGTWVNKSVYGSRHGLELFKSYENSESLYAVDNNKVFIPDNCILEYKSNGKGAQCLGKSNIHVFGDNNMKRNLKALTSRNNNWCNIDEIKKIKNKKQREEKMKCNCSHDDDDSEYNWIHDPFQPLKLTNSWDVDSNIHFHLIDKTIVNHQQEINQSIKEFVTNKTIVKPDIVMIGLGNADIEAIQVSPTQFTTSFIQFIKYIRTVYPKQKIIIKTPQYFCCGNINTTSWNTGRSLAFTVAIRNIIQSFADDINLLLWDVHTLGSDETTCLIDAASSYSKRNVINVENLLLWNLICEN